MRNSVAYFRRRWLSSSHDYARFHPSERLPLLHRGRRSHRHAGVRAGHRAPSRYRVGQPAHRHRQRRHGRADVPIERRRGRVDPVPQAAAQCHRRARHPRNADSRLRLQINEFEQEHRRDDPDDGLDLFRPAGQQLERRVADKAEGDAVGDRVGERHQQRGDRGRHALGAVGPIDFGQVAQHQAGDEQQRRRGRVGRHHAGDGREEQAGQEQQRDDDGGQSRAPTGLHAGRAFDVGGGAGRAEHRAGDDGAAVGQQRLVQARHLAVDQQAGAAGHAHQRAGGVEHLDQEEGQHHIQDADRQRALDVELQQRRADRRRRRHDAVQRVAAEDKAQRRHHDYADQDRALYLQAVQRDDQQEADDGHDGLWLVQVAQLHQRGRTGDDDAGAFQRDQRQEQSYADGDGGAQRRRYAVDDQLAQLQHADQDEQTAGDEYGAQRGLPRYVHAQHDGVGEVSVKAHAGRHRDRVVGVDAHDHRAQRGGQAGGDEDRVARHAGVAEYGGIDEDDVGHRQEGGDAGHYFGANVGAVCAEFEGRF